MIHRYVFVRLKPEYADDRGDIATYTTLVLAALPGVLGVHVGTPADPQAEAAWDIGVTLRFASLTDCDTFRHHPEHRRFADEYLAPRAQVIKAWSFDVGE